MHWRDLLGIAVSALYQQRVRTTLSVLGVMIGTLALSLSLSVGQGVEAAIVRLFRQNDQLRLINVQPSYLADESEIPPDALEVEGEMSGAKRERIREAIVSRWSRSHAAKPKALLTPEAIAKLTSMEHVASVTPTIGLSVRAVFRGESSQVTMASAAPDSGELRDRIVAGAYFATESGRWAIVHEHLLYSWGISGDAEVQDVLGRTIRLEYRLARSSRRPPLFLLSGGKVGVDSPLHSVVDRLAKRLPDVLASMEMTDQERFASKVLLEGLATEHVAPPTPLHAEDFTIIGVIRQWTKDDPEPGVSPGGAGRDSDILLPTRTAAEFLFRDPAEARRGVSMATVRVDREDHVKDVVTSLAERGYSSYSMVQVIEGLRQNVLLVTIAVSFIAVVSLMVASLGITNTMIMSVLERTREIGVMKAVGARDRDIRSIFLAEGALIGLLGAALGLLLCWLASFPGDAVARTFLEARIKRPADQSLFIFPITVTLGVPLISCLITTLAAYYPARRAVRVDPVTSLRHE